MTRMRAFAIEPGCGARSLRRQRAESTRRIALVLGGLLAFSPAACHRRPPVTPPTVPKVAQDVEELFTILDEVARTWRPSDRARLLERLRPEATATTNAMVWLLRQAGHPRRAAAVQLAGALGIQAARPALAEIVDVGPPELIRAAFAAAEAIEPWPATGLATLLESGTVEQRLAALEVCREREDRPVEAIEALLAVDDGDVLRAAIAALPARVSDAALRRLVWLADNEAGGEQARASLAGLQLGLDQRTLVLDQAIHTQPRTRLALATLCGLQHPAAAGLAWSLAASGSADERVAAITALDAAGVRDGVRLREVAYGMPRAGMFRVARCLVRCHEREGIGILLELAEGTGADDGTVRSEARQLLAALSGIPAAGTAQAWREWFATLPPDALEKLALPDR